MLVVLLLVLVVIVFVKTVHREIISSNFIETDSHEEIGWKMIKTEALLPPKEKMILTAFLGNGI